MAQQAAQIQTTPRQLSANQQQIGQELNAAEAGIYGQSVFGYNRALRSTGYIPTFANTGHYFSTNPALGAGGRLGGSGYGAYTGGGQIGPRAPFGGTAGGLGGAAGGRGAAAGGIRR